MMLGGLAFLYSDFFQNKFSKLSKNIISFLCFIVLFASIFYLSEDDLWPSYLTLLPTIASFLIIALYNEFPFYKYKVLQYISSISYSLYLWHWPVYVIAKYYDYKGWELIILLLVLSVLFSILSYQFIEKRTKLLPIRGIFITTFLTIIFTISTSFLSLNNFLFSKDAIALTEFKKKYEPTRLKQFNSGVCHNMPKINYKDCLCLDSRKKNILLLGDSHAGHYSLSLRKKVDSIKYNFIEHTVVGSLPLLNSQGKKSSTDQFKNLYKNFIVSNKVDIEIIILSAHWLTYKSSGGYNSENELIADINATIKFVENLGIKVIILGQTEKYNILFSRTKAFNIEGIKDKGYIDESSFKLNNALKESIPSKNYVDLFLKKDFTHYDKKSKMPYVFDQNHLTIYGTDQVVDFLINKKYF